MNKAVFISVLKKKLKRLPKEEVKDIINYYEEYFEDSNKSEEEVIAELGSPSAIASQILSDYAIGDKGNKLSLTNKILIAILAVFAAPIGIPIMIAVALTLLAIGLCFCCAIFAVSVTALVIIFSGVIFLIAGFSVIISAPASAFFYIGIGLLINGLFILIALGIKTVIPKASLHLKNLLSKIVLKFNSYRKRG